METVSDMIAGFLAGLTPGTRAQYRSVVSRWLRWCSDNGIDMLRAKRTHIEVFAAYGNGMRPAAKNTVYRNLSVVCCLYRYLCERGISTAILASMCVGRNCTVIRMARTSPASRLGFFWPKHAVWVRGRMPCAVCCC